MPGGPLTAPPCTRCGSPGDYYASGLCGRCHFHAPARFDSCLDCHAAGVTRTHKWLCRACSHWRKTYPVGVCRTCDTTVAVGRHGVCRLCRAQAGMVGRPFDVVAANRQGQQLFFANMHKHAVVRTEPRRRLPPPPPWPARPVSHCQLVLFQHTPTRLGGRSSVPAPRDTELADALDRHIDDYTARHHWSRNHITRVRSGIRVLLGLQDTPGAVITATEAAVLTQLDLPVRAVLEVLSEVGMAVDDRTPAIERWVNRQLNGLPGPMARELLTWFEVMHHGSTTPPRRRPRSPTTIKLYLRASLPALRAWADEGHQSLREISREHVVGALPPPGPDRALAGRGLSSIFVILKARKLVFTNPTSRVLTWSPVGNAPLPANLTPIRAALTSQDPARAAIASLVCFHGLRSGQVIALQLTDLRDHHLHLDGRVIPLAGPVQQCVTAWLDHRQARWPHSTNPHLFIHTRSANRHEPVGRRWVKLTLDIAGGTENLRQDRILNEAIATGGDTRRLCDLFGLSIGTASRYTQGLGDPHPAIDIAAGTLGYTRSPTDAMTGPTAKGR